MVINAKIFVNINADAKKPIIKTNLLLGSSLWIGLSSLVNLKPWTNLRDNPGPSHALFRSHVGAYPLDEILSCGIHVYNVLVGAEVPQTIHQGRDLGHLE